MKCKTPNCKTCTDPAVCTECRPLYQLGPANQCENCTSIANCGYCDPKNLMVCSGCKLGFQLVGQVCEGGIVCEDKSCSICDRKQACLQCKNRFYLSGSACVSCQENCAKCDNQGCQQCKDMHFMVNGKCTMLDMTRGVYRVEILFYGLIGVLVISLVVYAVMIVVIDNKKEKALIRQAVREEFQEM